MSKQTNEAPILVVDDEAELRNALCASLEVAGYQTVPAGDGSQALERLRSGPVALVVSDIAMPGMNGYQLLEEARREAAWVDIPFIFLTARGFDSDIRFGKSLGIDDYLVKPVDPRDLLASVEGKLRQARQRRAITGETRRRPQEAKRPGELVVDRRRHQAWWDGRQLRLSAREFELLAHLAERRGEVVRAQELLETTHQLQGDLTEAGALLRPLIRSIRRKMGFAAGNTGCIENVRGVGYRLRRPG